MDERFRAAALEYHLQPKPGKIAVTPTKSMLNPQDLALAYSPGVAVPCEEIQRDPANAEKYTARGNLVAVIPNGGGGGHHARGAGAGQYRPVGG